MRKLRLNSIIAGLIFITVFSCGDVAYSSSLQLTDGVFVSVENVSQTTVFEKEEGSHAVLLCFSLISNGIELPRFSLNNEKISMKFINFSNFSRAPPF